MLVEIIFHDETWSRQLRAVGDRVASGRGQRLREGLVRAARIYMQWVRARFFSASRHDGTWKDHAPSTKLAKLRKHAPGLLQRRQSAAKAVGAAIVSGGGNLTRVRAIDIAAGLTFPILYETGALWRSLRPGGPGYIERFVDPLTIRVGTSVPYAQYHQTGTSRMPQRTIQDVPPADVLRDMNGEIGKGVEQEIIEAMEVTA